MNTFRRLLLALVVVLLSKTVHAEPPAPTQRLAGVARMLDAAARHDVQAVWDAKAEVEELPYPARGDRRKARALNTSALDLFKRGQNAAAMDQLKDAWSADPSDPEIANNYGYVLARSGQPAEAQRLLHYTLALAPARAAAWGNLAEVHTSEANSAPPRGTPGDVSRARDCLVLALHFSRNPEATRGYIEKVAAGSDAAFKEAVRLALARPLPANARGASGTATLAGTWGERRTVGNPSTAQTPPDTVPSETLAASQAPVALTDPIGAMAALQTSPEAGRLYAAARRGSDSARAALLKMAQAGNARAQNDIGDLYDRGDGVAPNAEIANDWFRKSAAQGYPLAQSSLAWNQKNGSGTPVDFAAALDGYRRAAAQGHPSAMNNLGVMYERGQGVKADAPQAFDWFLRSAQAGLPRGIFNAASCFEIGYGTAVDKKRAFAYYLSAARVDFPQAQLKVAQGHEQGWTGAPDKARAIVWYRRAAHAGLDAAREALKRLGATEES